ncbi:hypothetical protein Maes01_01373 [Microbulbifer aestuariivivens]|uniref:Lipopolysaccharide biosynthesis protein n=1 Tax=Microbulbifer aestuariivivens TaxID=1908308 RepID=A0ABP9WP59_9GAMM
MSTNRILQLTSNRYVLKILSGVGANTYGQLVTLLTQLISVPIFLSNWGVEIYGQWLIISTIPAYLMLSDFGVGTVAKNKMVMHAANNEECESRKVYNAAAIFTGLLSCLLLVSVIVVISTDVAKEFLAGDSFDENDVVIAIVFLLLQVIVGMFTNLKSAVYTVCRRYAEGMVFVHTARLFEVFLSLAALILYGDIVSVALAGFSGRVLIYSIMSIRLFWLTQTYYLYPSLSAFQSALSLLKLGGAFIIFPMGLAISIQGMTLVVGSILGAAAVAQFNAIRTLTRVLVQIGSIVNHSLWPEITVAFQQNNQELLRGLWKNSLFFVAVSSSLASLFLSIFSEEIFSMWLGEFELDGALYGLMLFVAIMSASAQSSWIVLMATNNHAKFAIYYILTSILSVIIAATLMPIIGVISAGIGLLLSEIMVLVVSWKMSNQVMDSLGQRRNVSDRLNVS